MEFPSDEVLIARGKQATLKKERWQQIERVQSICRTVQGNATLILTDCQKKPPQDAKVLDDTIRFLENAKDAREKLITLNLGIEQLEEEAWPK